MKNTTTTSASTQHDLPVTLQPSATPPPAPSPGPIRSPAGLLPVVGMEKTSAAFRKKISMALVGGWPLQPREEIRHVTAARRAFQRDLSWGREPIWQALTVMPDSRGMYRSRHPSACRPSDAGRNEQFESPQRLELEFQERLVRIRYAHRSGYKPFQESLDELQGRDVPKGKDSSRSSSSGVSRKWSLLRVVVVRRESGEG